MDTVQEIEQYVKEENIKKAALEAERERTKKAAEYLTMRINGLANPSPIVVTAAVCGVLLVLWVAYRIFLKPNATGEWYDKDGNKIIISHNTLTGKAVDGNGKSINITDNLVKIGADTDITGVIIRIGVWDYENLILFTDGTSISRLR